MDLKATLTHFARRFFGATKNPLPPELLPFTSRRRDDVDASCARARGRGVQADGMEEILGSGMVATRVLEAAGVDAERSTGFAWGMGPARVAMQRYGTATSARCTIRTCGPSNSFAE